VQTKLAITSVLFHPNALAAGLREPLIEGAVLSVVTGSEVNYALLTALSVTVTVPVTPDPSVDTSKEFPAGFVENTPDRVSLGAKENETLVLFQPLALAAGLAVPNVRVGAVLSMLMPLLATGELVLPALSMHVPDDDVWAAPSLLTVTGLEQLSIPERESSPLKVTATLVLFQPLAFGTGEAATAAVGTVLSIFMPLTVADAEFPARSWQVLLTD
jgi:hypothetical protein